MEIERIVNIKETYISCDFCDKKAQYDKCFVCGKDVCKNHAKEFDIIDYDLVYICPDCEHKDFTELKKLNDDYMKLCEAGNLLISKINDEINKLK